LSFGRCQDGSHRQAEAQRAAVTSRGGLRFGQSLAGLGQWLAPQHVHVGVARANVERRCRGAAEVQRDPILAGGANRQAGAVQFLELARVVEGSVLRCRQRIPPCTMDPSASPRLTQDDRPFKRATRNAQRATRNAQPVTCNHREVANVSLTFRGHPPKPVRF